MSIQSANLLNYQSKNKIVNGHKNKNCRNISTKCSGPHFKADALLNKIGFENIFFFIKWRDK